MSQTRSIGSGPVVRYHARLAEHLSVWKARPSAGKYKPSPGRMWRFQLFSKGCTCIMNISLIWTAWVKLYLILTRVAENSLYPTTCSLFPTAECGLSKTTSKTCNRFGTSTKKTNAHVLWRPFWIFNVRGLLVRGLEPKLQKIVWSQLGALMKSLYYFRWAIGSSENLLIPDF